MPISKQVFKLGYFFGISEKPRRSSSTRIVFLKIAVLILSKSSRSTQKYDLKFSKVISIFIIAQNVHQSQLSQEYVKSRTGVCSNSYQTKSQKCFDIHLLNHIESKQFLSKSVKIFLALDILMIISNLTFTPSCLDRIKRLIRFIRLSSSTWLKPRDGHVTVTVVKNRK